MNETTYKVSNEFLDKLDDNNMKVKEILRTVLCLADAQCERLTMNGVDVTVLLDTALEYSLKNDEMFNNMK